MSKTEPTYSGITGWDRLEDNVKAKIKRVISRFAVNKKYTDAAVAPDGSSVELAWAQEKVDFTLEMIPDSHKGVTCRFTVFVEGEDDELTIEFKI